MQETQLCILFIVSPQLRSSGGASQSDELAPYHVPFFKAVAGEQKGSGSYGSVHLIEVNGIPCIAKQLHDILVGRNREEEVGIQQRNAIQRKFQNECILLSRLKHPNIVQFMGVHYDRHDPSNLTLIMEYLPMDLEKCLKLYANLPLSMIIFQFYLMYCMASYTCTPRLLPSSTGISQQPTSS